MRSRWCSTRKSMRTMPFSAKLSRWTLRINSLCSNSSLRLSNSSNPSCLPARRLWQPRRQTSVSWALTIFWPVSSSNTIRPANSNLPWPLFKVCQPLPRQQARWSLQQHSSQILPRHPPNSNSKPRRLWLRFWARFKACFREKLVVAPPLFQHQQQHRVVPVHLIRRIILPPIQPFIINTTPSWTKPSQCPYLHRTWPFNNCILCSRSRILRAILQLRQTCLQKLYSDWQVWNPTVCSRVDCKRWLWTKTRRLDLRTRCHPRTSEPAKATQMKARKRHLCLLPCRSPCSRKQ